MRASIAGLCLVLLASFIGCGHKKLKYADEPTLHEGLQITVEWLKPKGDTIDMRLVWHNTYNHALHFNSEAMTLNYDNQTVIPRGKPFTLSLAPNETVARVVIFGFGKKTPKNGTATFQIDPIYKGSAAENGNTKLMPYKRQLAVL